MLGNRKFLLSLMMGILFLPSCASNPPMRERGLTVAVWDLENLSPGGSSQPDLGELLSAQIIEAMKKRGDYVVVERERLLLALEELRLGTTSLVDDATRLKLGQLIGARRMILGAYQIIEGQIRLDLRVVEVETGRVRKAVQKIAAASELEGWLETARKAAEDL